MKLNLSTGLYEEDYKWSAYLHLVQRHRPNNLFGAILEYILDELEKEKPKSFRL